MAASLKVLVPEATVNYIQNPSFRYDTTGWTAYKCAISRVLDNALYGIASLKVLTDGDAQREGIYYRVNDLLGISDPITASAYVKGAGIVHIRLIEGSKEWVSKGVALHANEWTRLEVSGFSTGSNDVRVYIEIDGSTPGHFTFYVDGVQLERKGYATTYCDGDQPGCRWNIMDCASKASRDPYTRQGGRWVSLAGPCRDDDNIYVTVMGGMGMPALQHNIQSWALSPGSFYQNTKILERSVTMAFFVKHEDQKMTARPNIAPLHELRQQLIDILKPDKTAGGEPFQFSYQEEGGREIFVNMRYEAGLEGDWDLRNQWVNSFPVRFLCNDPMLWENNKHAQALDFQDTLTFSNVMARIDGTWSNLNYGVDLGVADFAVGKYGEIFAGGKYKVMDNSALATDPLIPGHAIAYWNGTKWVALSLNTTGPSFGRVYSIAVAPNGYLYATGTFTTIGGVAANYVAYYNGTTWVAMGTGLNDYGYAIEVAPNGKVFVAGNFTTAGGIACQKITLWDGSSWHAMGAQAGLNDLTLTLAITKDGSYVYAGGNFTDQFGLAGNALKCVCKYDVAANTFSAMGSGFDYAVNVLRLSPAGVLYAGGNFQHSGTDDIMYIARWNGSIWNGMDSGMTDAVASALQDGVFDIDVNANGQLIAAGNFSKAGIATADRIALFNGTTWVNLDIKMPNVDNYISAVTIDARGDVYVGFGNDLANNAFSCSGITMVKNWGTAEVYPTVYIKGQGTLRWLENQTTKKRVYFELAILANEEILIDFAKKSIISTIRGDLAYSILPGSDFADFSLIPGDNKIAMFVYDDVNAMAYIYHRPTHWSADATVNAPELP